MDEGFNTYSTARAIAQVYDPNYLALRYFGGFVPWVFSDIALSRETDGNRLPGYRRDAEERRAVHAVVPLLPGDRRQHHLQQDGAVAEHAWSAGSGGRRCSASCPRTSSAGSSSIRSRTTSSTWRTRSPAAISGWFFDQVYRSSNVFDYGVQDLKSEREGGQYRTTLIVRRYGEAIFPVDVRGDVQERRSGHRTLGRHAIAGSSTPTIVRRRRCRRRSIRIACCCSTSAYTNNSKTLEPQGGGAATKWSLKWMVWLQECLLSWAALV